MTAWTVEHSLETTAKRQSVWQVWTDIDHWPAWDPHEESSHLKGELRVGAKGKAKSRGAPASTFTVTSVREGEQFATLVKRPLVRLEFEHELAETATGTTVTQRVTISGALAGPFSRFWGGRIDTDLPLTLEALARRAQS